MVSLGRFPFLQLTPKTKSYNAELFRRSHVPSVAQKEDPTNDTCEPIERIFCGEKLAAVIIRSSLPREGYNFVTENDHSLQVGINHYEKGSEIQPHYHLPLPRALTDTQEFLHIDSGKCLLTLFDDQQLAFFETLLMHGDSVVLISGGHGLKLLEPTRIIEVKQGPYLGPTKDKAIFQGKPNANKITR